MQNISVNFPVVAGGTALVLASAVTPIAPAIVPPLLTGAMTLLMAGTAGAGLMGVGAVMCLGPLYCTSG